MAEYTEELYKKDLHDPDNPNDVITYLELDILECEVKWAIGSITTNKASGGDGIPDELFQILKDDAVKVDSEKAGSELNIQKTETMASGPITSWQIDGGKVETVADFIFSGSKYSCLSLGLE